MEKAAFELRLYRNPFGRSPFTEWIGGLDHPTATRVKLYVDRMKARNFGASRLLAEGVWELKIDIGPGFRAYYLREGHTVVLLLCGGDKSSQNTDILRARRYAADHRRVR